MNTSSEITTTKVRKLLTSLIPLVLATAWILPATAQSSSSDPLMQPSEDAFRKFKKQVYIPGQVVNETLPPFTGGNTPLMHYISEGSAGPSENLKFKLIFNPMTRVISGEANINASNKTRNYHYGVLDSSGEPDRDSSISFSICIYDTKPVLENPQGASRYIIESFYRNQSVDYQLPIAENSRPDSCDLTEEKRRELHVSELDYSLTGDDLPDGLEFSADTQMITGTPTTTTTESRMLKYKVTDEDGDYVDLTIILSIAEPTIVIAPDDLILQEITDLTFNVGQMVSQSLGGNTGAIGTPTYSLLNHMGNEIPSVNGMADLTGEGFPGLVYHRFTQTIHGTLAKDAEVASEITFEHRVTDAAGRQRSREFKMSIVDIMPEINEDGEPTEIVASIGVKLFHNLPSVDTPNLTDFGFPMPEIENYENTIVTSVISNDPTMTGLPTGLFYHAPSRRIIGVPTETRAATSYTYRVTDRDGDAADDFTFTIEVIEERPIVLDSAGENKLKSLPSNPIMVGQETAITLPAFTGGNGNLIYSLVASDGTETESDSMAAVPLDDLGLPGLFFHEDTRRIYGTLSNDVLKNGRSITLKYCAEDTNRLQGIRLFTLRFKGGVDPITAPISGTNLTFKIGQDYTLSPVDLPAFTGGTGELTYALIDSDGVDITNNANLSAIGLPEIMFNPNTRTFSGSISGTTADDSRDLRLTYQATDNVDNILPITIEIKVVDSLPSFTSSPTTLVAATGNRFFEFLPAVDEGTGTGTITYTLLGNWDLGHNLRFRNDLGVYDGADPRGLIYGTPDTVTNLPITRTYSATDEDGDIDTLTFTLQVVDSSTTIPSIDPVDINVDTAVNRTLEGLRSNQADITYSITDLDGNVITDLADVGLGGLTYNPSTRNLTGTISTDMDDTIDVRLFHRAVNNMGTVVGNRQFLVRVKDSVPTPPTSGTAFLFTRGQDLATIPTAKTPKLQPFTGGNGTLSYTLYENDGENLITSSTELIGGIRYNPVTRTFRGTVSDTMSAIGGTTYTYTATDEDGDSASVEITIKIRAKSLRSEPNGSIEIEVGQSLVGANAIILNVFTGGEGEPTYSLVDSNGTEIIELEDIDSRLAGLTYNQSNRAIEGIITDTDQNQSIATPIILKHCAIDSQGVEGRTLFTLTVRDRIPSFAEGTSIAPIVAIVDTDLADQNLPALPEITDGTGTGTINYALQPSPALPTGLTFNDGAISGTPTQISSRATYTYIASEGTAGDSATLSFDLQVVASMPPSFGEATISNMNLPQYLETQSINLPKATVGMDYGEVTYSLIPTPPAGLEFNSETRKLSGTPTTIQSATRYTYMATATTSSVSVSTSLTFTIEIMPRLQPQPIEPFPVEVGQAFGGNDVEPLAEFKGGVEPITYSLLNSMGDTVTTLDSSGFPGLEFKPATRTIEGMYKGTNEFDDETVTFTLRGVDAEGRVDNIDFTINSTDTVPIFEPSDIESNKEREAINQVQFSHTFPIARNAIEYTLTNKGDSENLTLPIGLSLLPDDRKMVLTGTPNVRTVPDTYRYTYTATDEDKDPVSIDFTLIVTTDSVPTAPEPSRFPALNFYVGQIINDIFLPAGSGGNGELKYGIRDAAADEAAGDIGLRNRVVNFMEFFPGLKYDPDTRGFFGTLEKLPNTPAGEVLTHTFFQTVRDIDRDKAETEFTISVVDLKPAFSIPTDAIEPIQVVAIKGEQLTFDLGRIIVEGDTTHVSEHLSSYKESLEINFDPMLPDGFSFDIDTGLLSGRSETTIQAATYTITVTDRNGKPDCIMASACDSTELFIRLSVVEDVSVMPATPIGPITIMVREDLTASPKTLPEFTGGNGQLTYSIMNARGDTVMDGESLDKLDSKLKGLTAVLTSTEQHIIGTILGDAGDDSEPPIPLKFCVEDANGDISLSLFTIEVQDSMPSFAEDASIANIVATSGTEYTSEVLPAAAVESGSPTYTITPALPTGLNLLIESTSVIHGTPTAVKAVTTYTYTAMDTDEDTATLIFTITVEEDTTPMPPAGPLSYTFTVGAVGTGFQLPIFTGGNGELTYSIVEELPAGLTFDANTRMLSGTPSTKHEASDYTYRAIDEDGDSATFKFTLIVDRRMRPTSTTVVEPITVIVGKEYPTNGVGALELHEFTGGVGVLIHSLADENGKVFKSFSELSSDYAGLTYDKETRIISGTIEDTTGDQSVSSITLKHCAIDSEGNIGFRLFTLTVVDVIPRFEVETIDTVVAYRGTELTQVTLPEAKVSIQDAAVTYSVSPRLPAGLTFNSITQQINGTPTAIHNASTTRYTYTATEGSSIDEATLNFRVAVTTNPLVSRTISPILAVVKGEAVSRVLPTFKGGSGRLTHSLTEENGDDITTESRWVELGLGGLSYDPTTRTLSGRLEGTPNNDDSDNVTLKHKAADENGAVATQSFQVIVEDSIPSFYGVPSSLILQAQIGERYYRELPQVVEGTGSGYISYSLTRGATSGSASLPAGFRFTIFGSISGTATAISQAETYTYTARDRDGDTSSPITITLSVGENALRLPKRSESITINVREDYIGDNVIVLDEFIGGTPPYTYSLTDRNGAVIDDLGTLLEGLSHDPNTGTISGTFLGTASFDGENTRLYRRAVDQNGVEAVSGLTIFVSDSIPMFDPDTDGLISSIDENGNPTYAFEINFPVSGRVYMTLPTVVDITGNGEITYELSEPIPGIRHNSTTNYIRGTYRGGQTTRTVTATDVDGDFVQFQLILNPANLRFRDAAIADGEVLTLKQGVVMEPVTLPLARETASFSSLNYRLIDCCSNGDDFNLPEGLEYDPITRILSGTPTSLGTSREYQYSALTEDTVRTSLSFSIEVVEHYNGEQITINVLQDYTGEKAFTLDKFAGDTGDFTYSLTDRNGGVIDGLGTIVEGLSYDPNTTIISGIFQGTTVDDTEDIDLFHRAEDQNGVETVRAFRINVRDSLPRFEHEDIRNGVYLFYRDLPLDGSVNYDLPEVARGYGNRTPAAGITYSFSEHPNNEPHKVIFNPVGHRLEGTYTGLDSISFTLTATDADGDRVYMRIYLDQVYPIGDFDFDDFYIPPLIQGVAMTPFTFPKPTGTPVAYDGILHYGLGRGYDFATRQILIQTDSNLEGIGYPGLWYDFETRTISGTPTSLVSNGLLTYVAYYIRRDGSIDDLIAISFTIEVVAPEPDSDSDSEVLGVGLDEVIGLSPPVVEEVMVMSGREMAPVVLPDFGYEGPYRLTYSVTGLPQGVEFTPATRMLSGTPEVIGVNEVVYTATDEVGNSGATLFTLTVMDAMLTDATRSAIPAVSTSVAMAATASVASRISQALSGATRALDITTASGQRFQFDPSSSSGSSGSRRDPLRFGFWFNTATDELSDTRYDVSTNSTTDSSNFGFDVSLDFNPDTTLVLGVMQNNSTTETEFRGVGALSGGEGSEGSLALDLNTTALYAALGWRGFNLWAASGDNNTYVAGTTSDVGLPAAFNYQTVGFSADFEVFEDLRIGARVETLQSDFSVPGQGRQLLGDLASASSHTKATLTLNYQLELGRESNGLLTPSFEFGTRDLSTTEQFQTTRSNARDTASELGFGLDYKQLAWGLTLGLDVSSMAVQNYSSQSVRWSVRWESGHHGKGLSLSLAPTTVAQTLGVDNIYNGDYGSYKSLVNRQFSDDSAVSGEGVNVEMGIGFLSGTGTFTPFVKATNLYGSGASTQAFGVRYSAASSTSFELKFTQQSRSSGLGGSGNSLTLGNSVSAVGSSRDDLERALEFSTRYSF